MGRSDGILREMWACDWIIDKREPGIPQGGEREGRAPGSKMMNREGKRAMFVGGLSGNVGSGNRGCRQLTEAGAGRKREWVKWRTRKSQGGTGRVGDRAGRGGDREVRRNEAGGGSLGKAGEGGSWRGN